mmetsp:Transcript_4037/g.13594  ORF Transcript_4037/g.13594 Transcript_4037/m.13594 type:complete len:234 (-) Transcript_4037:142-843(-)
MVANHLECPRLEKLLLVARRKRAGVLQALGRHGDAVADAAAERLVVHEEVHEAVEAVVDLTRRLDGHALAPIVVGMLKIADPTVITLAPRRVLGRGHSCVPLANHMRFVAGRLQLLSNARHVPRDARSSTHRVRRVHNGHACVDGVYVQSKPATLQGRPGWRADLVRVVAVQQNALVDQRVHVRGVRLQFRLLRGALTTAVHTHVRPTIIVCEDEQHMRLLWRCNTFAETHRR